MNTRQKTITTTMSIFLMISLFVAPSILNASANDDYKDLPLTSRTFINIAEKASPAVVYIEVEKKIQVTRSGGPLDQFNREFFERFFRHRLPQQEPQEKQEDQEQYIKQGQGSGFIISKDGYILTNNHVVEDADLITVKLSDKREFKAEVVGTDPQSDIGVIKIEADDLPILPLGSSEELQVGEGVIAIGNPFGLSRSVTSGIISAKGRSNIGIVDYEDFIQTDAAINPGNSGGPLLNLKGEAVGVNTAIFSRSGGYMGIGFAIPIDMANNIYQQLREDGEITRGYLGVMIQSLSQDLAESFDLEKNEGALISDVMEDTPAAKAGLKSGDVIIELNHEPVKDSNLFRNKIASLKPGTKIELTVIRAGKEKSLTVTIGKRDEEALAAVQNPKSEIMSKIGLAVQELTPDIAEQLGYEDEEGVVVSKVEQGSSAARKGIQKGALIVEVNQKTVKTADQFYKQVKKGVEKGSVLLLVRQGNVSRYVAITF